MNKYTMTTSKKKAAIITTSLDLFNKYGYSHVSMKMIAATSNVSQASIYNYFKNKEELVNECVKLVLQDMLEHVNETLSSDISYKKKVEQALMICNTELNKAISKFLNKESETDLKYKEILMDSINSFKNSIYERFIIIGKEEGELNKEIPTALYLSYIQSLNSIGNSFDFDVNDSQNITYIHELFLYGFFYK